MIPIRRMTSWAKDNNVLWALDPKQKTPTIKEIKELPIESSGMKESGSSKKSNRKTVFLIKTTKPDGLE
jgi:hypothetical protein